MKANPSKFKAIIMSSEYIEPQELTLSDDVCLQSQTGIKVSGITVDQVLIFNEHIRVRTLKATRQLSALSPSLSLSLSLSLSVSVCLICLSVPLSFSPLSLSSLSPPYLSLSPPPSQIILNTAPKFHIFGIIGNNKL